MLRSCAGRCCLSGVAVVGDHHTLGSPVTGRSSVALWKSHGALVLAASTPHGARPLGSGLAMRRRDMGTVPVADANATRRLLWRSRPPDQAAALRTLVVGLRSGERVRPMRPAPRAAPRRAAGDHWAPHVECPAQLRSAGGPFGTLVGCPAGLAEPGVWCHGGGPCSRSTKGSRRRCGRPSHGVVDPTAPPLVVRAGCGLS